MMLRLPEETKTTRTSPKCLPPTAAHSTTTTTTIITIIAMRTISLSLSSSQPVLLSLLPVMSTRLLVLVQPITPPLSHRRLITVHPPQLVEFVHFSVCLLCVPWVGFNTRFFKTNKRDQKLY